MRDKRDQLHAHLFMVGRLISAVVRGEPDAPQSPMRRSSTGTHIGLAITMVIVAGLIGWGFLRPGANTDWQADGALVIEKETGALYLNVDGRLHPSVNYSSGLLAAGNGGSPITVSAASLDEAPRGAPVGIVGAPDGVLAPPSDATGAWEICATTDVDPDPNVDDVVSITVLLDPDRESAAAARRNSAVLVSSTDTDDTVLVVDGRRHTIADPSALASLGYEQIDPTAVRSAWLNALSPGSDIAPPDIADRGEPAIEIDTVQHFVGQVFVVERIQRRSEYFVLLADGMLPVSETTAALLLGDPATIEAYPDATVEPIEISGAELGLLGESPSRPLDRDWPESPPSVDALGDGVACLRVDFDPDDDPRTSVVVRDEVPDAVELPDRAGERTGLSADHVVARAGNVDVVGAVAAPGQATGTRFVVTELGVKYPIASDDAAAALGLAGAEPALVFAELLDFLPTGPALDPDAARTIVPIQPAGG
ncbi:MAG: type VII secretion protein EccB [Actinomycetota bacterium]